MIFFVFVLLYGTFGMTASAYDEANYVILKDSYEMIPIPVTHNPVSADKYFGETVGQLNAPRDIFITDDDRIYIVDGGNNRVISMNSDYSDAKYYDNFSGETLKNPNGIYVYANGDMLITDTDNGRIIKADKDGKLIRIYTQPTSEIYDKKYPFKPLKVNVNVIGQIYVINNDDYHGFVVLEENNELKGYVAPTKLSFSLKSWIINNWASEEQKAQLTYEKPPVHTNAVFDKENSLYVTTARAETAQLKKFSTVGVNTYPNTGFFGDFYGDETLFYYDKEWTEPYFTDVSVNDKDIVTILDNASGHIYQYDQEGNMLMAFAGTGTWTGKFTDAVGLDQDSKGNLYVIDAKQSVLHKFEATNFTKTVHKALELYYAGNYDGAVEYWEQVLDMNPNYPMAHIGMGNAYLKNDEYQLAMEEFRQADERGGYSNAFDENQLESIRENFAVVLFAIIAIVVAVVLIIRYLMRRYTKTYERESRIKWFNRKGRLQILLGVLFDPTEGFRNIRRHRKDYDVVIPVIIYVLVFAARLTSLVVKHYPFKGSEIYGINIAKEAIYLFLPLFSWIIGNYLVTTIRAGEVKIKEVFSATAYSMLPYIIVTVPLSFATNIMSLSSQGLYSGINTLMWIWIGILFFVSTMSMNSYRFVETIKAILLALFACVFMWVIFAMIFMLGQQVFDFFGGIANNYKVYFSLQGGAS